MASALSNDVSSFTHVGFGACSTGTTCRTASNLGSLASHTVSSHHLKLMSAGSDDMAVHMNRNIFLTSSYAYSSGKKYFEVTVRGVKLKVDWLQWCLVN